MHFFLAGKPVVASCRQQLPEQRVVCLWCKRHFLVNIGYAYIHLSVCLVTTAGYGQAHSTPYSQYGELDNIISFEEFRNLLSLFPISALNDDLNFSV